VLLAYKQPQHFTIRDLGADAQSHAIDYLSLASQSSSHSWESLRNALADDATSTNKDPFRRKLHDDGVGTKGFSLAFGVCGGREGLVAFAGRGVQLTLRGLYGLQVGKRCGGLGALLLQVSEILCRRAGLYLLY
jgi:hypothetical protein